MIGLPFFVLATTAPLLQRWFAKTGHKDARDPYFLYAASNLGSLLALVAYPAVIEPGLTLANQAWLWAGGYVLFLALTVGCAKRLWDTRRGLPDEFEDYHKSASPPIAQRLSWVALAFVPS